MLAADKEEQPLGLPVIRRPLGSKDHGYSMHGPPNPRDVAQRRSPLPNKRGKTR